MVIVSIADLDALTLVIAEADLKPNLKGLDRFPSVVTRYAAINDVTRRGCAADRMTSTWQA